MEMTDGTYATRVNQVAGTGGFGGASSLPEMRPSMFLSRTLSDRGASSISAAERTPSAFRSSATIRGEGSAGGGGVVPAAGGGGRSSLRVSLPSPFLSRWARFTEDFLISSGEIMPSWLLSSATSSGDGGGGGGGVAADAVAAATRAMNKWMRVAFMVYGLLVGLLSSGTLAMEHVPCELRVWILPLKCKFLVKPVGGTDCGLL